MKRFLRNLFRNFTRSRKAAAGRRERRVQLQVEGLEGRLTPTITFGNNLTMLTQDSGTRITGAHVNLVFLGNYWTSGTGQTNAGKVQSAVNSILQGSYFDGLQQYGVGKASLARTFTITDSGFNTASTTAASFTDADVRAALRTHVANFDLPSLVTDGQELLMAIVPPNYTNEQPGNGTEWGRHGEDVAFNGYLVQPFYYGYATSYGAKNTFTLDSLTGTFSHELAEAVTDPDVNVNGTGLQIRSTSTESWNEIGDDFTYNTIQRYLYRLGGANGPLVQAYWSTNDKADIVSTGQTQNFLITPSTSAAWKTPYFDQPNYSFFGGTLTINGDQLANKNDRIIIDQAASGGVLVTLNGETAQFEPGQITGIVINAKTGSDSINVERLSSAVSLTINAGSGYDVIDFSQTAHQLDNIEGKVTINHGSGGQALVLHDQANGATGPDLAPVQYQVTANSLSRFHLVAQPAYLGGVRAYGLTISGGFATGIEIDGGNTTNIYSVSKLVEGSALTIRGGSGADIVSFDDSADPDAGGGKYTFTTGNFTRAGRTTSYFTLSVNYSGIESLEVKGAPRGNEFDVRQVLAATSLTIDTGDGVNTVNIGDANNTVGPLGGKVQINGGTSYNALTLNDRALANTSQARHGVAYTVTDHNVQRNDSESLYFAGAWHQIALPSLTIGYKSISDLEIDGGPTGNAFDVQSTPQTTTLWIRAGTDSTSTPNTVTVGDATNNLNAVLGTVHVLGEGGTTSLTVDDRAASYNSASNSSYTLTDLAIHRHVDAQYYGPGGRKFTLPLDAWIDFSSVSIINLYAASKAANTLNVQNVLSGTPVTVTAGSLGDTINVGKPADPTQPTAASSTLASIQALLTLHGQGKSTLNVNDQGTTTNQGYDIWFDHIDWAPSGTSSYPTWIRYDGLTNLVLNGSSGQSNLPGVCSTAAGTTTVVNGNGTSDEFVVTNNSTLDGMQGNLNLHARAGAVYSYVLLSDYSNTASHTYRLSSPRAGQNEIERFDTQGHRDLAPITYEGQDEEVFYTPWRGGQVINLESNAGPGSNYSAGIFTIVTTAAGDTVNVGRPNPNGPGRLLDQLQFEVSLNSYSNTGSPTINIDDSADSVGRQATFDTSSYAYNITGLGLPTTTFFGQPFQSIIYLALFGGGTVHALGGSGGNVFLMNSAPAFGLSIDGGSGANWLDYSSYGSGVSVNLQTGAATGLAGISRIENGVGSAFNDTIIGDALNNIFLGLEGNDDLEGGGGRNVLIGGAGADTLVGGSADDILIGGSTSYDAQRSNGAVTQAARYVALDLIMAEWASADSNSLRRQYLSSGGGGQNQGYLLNSSTVFDDGSADTLTGNGGQDWFFAGTGDTVRA